MDDRELLARFARGGDAEAFGELVKRHVDLVYSAASRILNGDLERARDVAQVVFSDLARKAGKLSPEVVLTGWLYEAARRGALKAIRSDHRRAAREAEAFMTQTSAAIEEPTWEELGPKLDEALGQLSETDRNAVLLRFFERQDFRKIGAALRISDDAAQKRVSRALEKLREQLGRAGVQGTALGIGALIMANAVQAAPVGLACGIEASTLAVGPGLLKAALVAAIIASVLGPIAALDQQRRGLSAEVEALRIQSAKLREQGRNREANPKSLRDEDFSELLRLRGEVALLRKSRQDESRALVKTNAAPLIASISFTGNSAYPDDLLKTIISSKPGEPMDRQRVDADVRAIFGLYSRAGHQVNVRAAEADEELSFVVSSANPSEPENTKRLIDLGSKTPEDAVTTFMWASQHGLATRVAELLELPPDVPAEEQAKHFEFFAKTMGRRFSSLRFTTVKAVNEREDGTVRIEHSYRKVDTDEEGSFPFDLRQHGDVWKVVVRK